MAISGDISAVGVCLQEQPPSPEMQKPQSARGGGEGPWEEPVRGYEGITGCRVDRGESETFVPG